MKKIIIFGATGNVGSYVLKYAKSYFNPKEYQIIASGRRKTDFFKKREISYYSVDIRYADEFKKLPKEDVYAVINLAAQIPSYMKEYHAEKYIESNIIGAYHILEYCREVKADRILFATTVFDISLYAKDNIVLHPNMPLNFDYKGDHAVYVITKNTVIELLKHYYAEYGLKYFIFRFPTIYSYSPYQYYYPNGIKTMRPLYKMIHQALQGEDIELWGNPEYSKDMVYVDDCAQMLCKAIEVSRENGLYNVGTGKPVTLRKQIETIIDVFSTDVHKSKIVYVPEKEATGGFLMDIQNAIEELGYQPRFEVEDLFRELKKEMQINRFAELRMIE